MCRATFGVVGKRCHKGVCMSRNSCALVNICVICTPHKSHLHFQLLFSNKDSNLPFRHIHFPLVHVRSISYHQVSIHILLPKPWIQMSFNWYHVSWHISHLKSVCKDLNIVSFHHHLHWYLYIYVFQYRNIVSYHLINPLVNRIPIHIISSMNTRHMRNRLKDRKFDIVEIF